MSCEHKNFFCNCKVARIEDIQRFVLEITVKCTDCNTEFQFIGLKPGFNYNEPRCSIDALEMSVGIVPKGTVPAPIHLLGFDWDFPKNQGPKGSA